VIGKQVGNYRVNLQIGEDNLGILYLGEHVAAGFPVLLRHFAAQFTDVQTVARYLEIARHVSALQHPGIWQVRESVWSGRNAFMVGEPLPLGDALDTILSRDGRLFTELTVKLGWQLAAALAASHSANAFHCRLDSDSVYCYADPSAPGGYRAKIMDFGVAAFLDAGTPDWRSPRVEAFGLPFYMSPEQCRAGLVDFRGDVYGLGCLLYHMAVGQPPFTGTTPREIVASHAAQAPKPLQQIDQIIPFELDALVQRMLTKEPAGRPTMPEVAFELERIAKQYWSAPTAERTVQLDLNIGQSAPPMAPMVQPRRRSPLLLAAVVIGSMMLVGVGVALVTRPWEKKSAAAEAEAAPVAEAPAPAPEPTPEPAPARPPARPQPPPPPPESEVDKLVREGKLAVQEARFPDAAAALKAAKKLEPKNPAVVELATAVSKEPANKKALDEFMKAAAEKDAAKAVRRYTRIPLTSVFRPQAERTMKQVEVDFMHVKMAEAKALADVHMCAKLPPIEKQVAAVFPESAAKIKAVADKCQ